MAAKRQRLDQLLVDRKLAESRTQAQALILAGRVSIAGQVSDKPGRVFPSEVALELKAPPRFVSRGGEKLLAAIEHFGISFAGCHVLDVGASTGGFTDCALQHGAVDSTCVDVGRAQLHDRLRRDERVTNLEQVNARTLDPKVLPRREYDRIVMDLSFISLRSVLPAVWPLLVPTGLLVALVKPQFEAGREEATRGRGVIRDEAVRHRVIESMREFAGANLPGCVDRGYIDSPITGADGNREFLLLLAKEGGIEKRDPGADSSVLPPAPPPV